MVDLHGFCTGYQFSYRINVPSSFCFSPSALGGGFDVGDVSVKSVLVILQRSAIIAVARLLVCGSL